MNFNQLPWGALCFYYRSAGDHKYGKIMRNTSFLSRFRETPSDISVTEFEENVILGHVNIENYDLLIGHNLAGRVLARIIELQPDISDLKDVSLLDFDFSDSDIVEKIKSLYGGALLSPWLVAYRRIKDITSSE